MTRSLLALGLACLPVLAETISFDRARVGPIGKGWSVAMTHEGGAPRWEVLADASAPSRPNVLAQTSADNTSGRFPLAVYDRAKLTNGWVSVRFKPVSGERDQAAGMVWRYKDPENYYIVRANALEDNVVVYKVEGGKRISLEPKGTPSRTYGVRRRVPKGVWSVLKVRFQGTSFTVFFDSAQIMTVDDGTFQGAGKTGLWTKADSVTYFDDFQLGR